MRAEPSGVDELLIAADLLEDSGGFFSARLLNELVTICREKQVEQLSEMSAIAVQRLLLNHCWEYLEIEDVSISVIQEARSFTEQLVAHRLEFAATVFDAMINPLICLDEQFVVVLMDELGIPFWQIFIAAMASFQLQDTDWVTALVKCQYSTWEDLIRARSIHFGLKVVTLGGDIGNLDIELAECCSQSCARELGIVPFELDGDRLTVVVSDPTGNTSAEKISRVLNRTVKIVLATPAAIQRRIDELYFVGYRPRLLADGQGFVDGFTDDDQETEELREERQTLDEISERELGEFRRLWTSTERQPDSRSDPDLLD